MRMWMIDPGTLCDEHLHDEHNWMHMLEEALRQGEDLQSYLDNDYLEPQNLEKRHTQLVREFKRRGVAHDSPLAHETLPPAHERPQGTVDPQQSRSVLWTRCNKCRVQRSERLGERIDTAWFFHHPEKRSKNSTYGSRRWLARRMRVTPQTLDKYLRAKYPPDRAESLLDAIEEQYKFPL